MIYKANLITYQSVTGLQEIVDFTSKHSHLQCFPTGRQGNVKVGSNLVKSERFALSKHF